MTATLAPAHHPAKYSAGIVTRIGHALARYVAPGDTVLDPFAGIGGIHVFAPEYDTVGIELEPEWAACHDRTRLGSALDLPFPDSSVGAVVTSPCYGNRMADQYLGQNDSCRACGGDGLAHGSAWMTKPCECCTKDHYLRDCPYYAVLLPEGPCPSCDGTGQRPNVRSTYATSLGRKVSDGSGAGLQWGAAYRAFHVEAWREAARVLKPGGVLMLNISDHVRNDTLQGVSIWHATVIARLGMTLVESVGIPTRRMKHGANRDLRPQAEWLLVFRMDPF